MQWLTRMKIPKKSLLLLSGIPAAGKSSFGRYLAREYDFAHYDLECYPRGWPHRDLKPIWESSRANFVAQLKVLHERIVLDWGFPATHVPWIKELLATGVRLVWFTADIDHARKLFEDRGGIDVNFFNDQVRAIQRDGLPNPLPCVKVEGLTDAGTLRDSSEIFREVFAA
jgi:hypothetical protein